MPPSCSVGGMGLEPSLLKDIRPSGRPSEGFPRPFPAWGGVLSPEGPQLGGIGVVLRLSTSPTSAGYRDVVHTVHTRRPSTLPLCLRSRSGTLPHGASRNTPPPVLLPETGSALRRSGSTQTREKSLPRTEPGLFPPPLTLRWLTDTDSATDEVARGTRHIGH